MEWLRIIAWRLRGLFGKKRGDQELDTELRGHLEALTEENIRRGMHAEQARRAAHREFGGLEQTKELYRERRGLPFFDAVVQDTRFAIRSLRKRPAFAAVAILTLAVGIGSTTAIFSVVDRILFRALPYPHDEELVSFGDTAPFESLEFVLGPDYFDWRRAQTPFASLTSLVPGGRDCDLTQQNPARLKCALVESTFLPTFGIQPFLGRNFTGDEDQPNGPRVALISYGLWRSRFASNPELPGQAISLDGHPTVVVGVLPKGFEMPTLGQDDILLPAQLDGSTDRSPQARQTFLRAFARLKPGISVAQAAAAMQPLFQQSLHFVPPQFQHEVSFRVRSLRDRQIQDARTASWMFMIAVVAVLLVSCTNVASLLLARATGRQRELAVRAALGATKARLIRQGLTESLALASLGGAVGWVVAYALLRVLVSIAPDGVPRLEQAQLDFRVLIFAVAASLASGLIFGLAPAMRQPSSEMLAGKDAGRRSSGFIRQSLMAAQIAAALVLLTGAGLLLRSLWNLETVPLGMDVKHTLDVQIALAQYRYPNATAQLAFFRRVAERVQAIPGVTQLAISDTLPPSGGMQATFLSSIEIPHHVKFSAGTGGMIGYRYVTPEYFAALGVPILAGRGFRPEDLSSAECPVILSETLGKKLFPGGEDPLGNSFRFGSQSSWRIIVGIAGDVKNDGLARGMDPEFYIPWKQEPDGYFQSGHLVLRSPLPVDTLVPWVRREVAEVDATVPVVIETMNTRVRKLADRPRFNALLLSLLAGIGVTLAAIGVYGLVAFLVAQQTREIGIRMALGARPRKILVMVLKRVALWTAAGATLGLFGAWFCMRLLKSLLFQVQDHDPYPLALALMGMLAVALFAAWVPARRAMRVDPMSALRHE